MQYLDANLNKVSIYYSVECFVGGFGNHTHHGGGGWTGHIDSFATICLSSRHALKSFKRTRNSINFVNYYYYCLVSEAEVSNSSSKKLKPFVRLSLSVIVSVLNMIKTKIDGKCPMSDLL